MEVLEGTFQVKAVKLIMNQVDDTSSAAKTTHDASPPESSDTPSPMSRLTNVHMPEEREYSANPLTEQLAQMFPSLDKGIVEDVLASEGQNAEAAIPLLLMLSGQGDAIKLPLSQTSQSDPHQQDARAVCLILAIRVILSRYFAGSISRGRSDCSSACSRRVSLPEPFAIPT